MCRLQSSAAFRLNAMGESSEVADRDYVKNRRWGVAPSLAFGIGEDDSLTLAYLHQQENNVPGLPASRSSTAAGAGAARRLISAWPPTA